MLAWFRSLATALASRSLASQMMALLLIIYLLLMVLLALHWSDEPDLVDTMAKTLASQPNAQAIPGVITTGAIIQTAEILLNKKGGYMSNDIAPPGIFLDNMPNWELGVLVQLRDMVRIMRNDLSRSQSQSKTNQNLTAAENHFFFENKRYWLPSTESQYQKGIKELQAYQGALANQSNQNAWFFARADNLVSWLLTVETRLGDLSQQLSLSTNPRQLNLDSTTALARKAAEEIQQPTPWYKIDDIFYQARGQTYALIHILHAIEQDFKEVLKDKNALVSLRQITKQLEATQDPVWSPVILNGSGLGFLANHSLVMSSYISRANAGLIDLRQLLADG